MLLKKIDEITDIDICDCEVEGKSHFIWLTNSQNMRYKKEVSFPQNFIEQFTKRVANTVSRSFHKQAPILEAETETLRITIVHESVSVSGRSISIRNNKSIFLIVINSTLPYILIHLPIHNSEIRISNVHQKTLSLQILRNMKEFLIYQIHGISGKVEPIRHRPFNSVKTPILRFIIPEKIIR